VNARAFVVFGALLLTLTWVDAALADGAYQRTNDLKKAFVWNNDPQPGDIASWAGDRDADGYATGEGTLSWYKTGKTLLTGSNVFFRKKIPTSRYSGNMVRGKFAGAVVTVDHGKTYHATFTDGHRKGYWVEGPIPATAEIAETKPAEPIQERTEAVSAADRFQPGERASEDVLVETPSARPISGAARVASESAEPEPPAEGPDKAEDRDQTTEVSKSTAQKPSDPDKRLAKNSESSSEESSADEPEQSASPRAPVTKRAALAPGAVHAIEQPGRVAKKSEAEPGRERKAAKAPRASSEQKEEKPASAKDEQRRSEPPKIAKTEPERTDEQTASPAEGPLSAEPEKIQTPKSKSAITEPQNPSTQETPVDDSIRTLTGPPTSLHANLPADAKTTQEISAPSTTAVSSPAQATPKLTAVEAMDAADIEARTKGYDLGEYQLPKAEFNATNGTWSVMYVRRDGDKSGKQLSVTVQDKYGKAEVRK
jgi:hypothetical protein